MQDPTDPSPRTRSERRTELFIGACVVLISLISLVVAVNANRTQERLLAASNWPYLQFTTGNADERGKPEISLNVINSGVGPARIRYFAMDYEGLPVDDSVDLLRKCCATPATRRGALGNGTSAIDRRVLSPNEQVTFMRYARQPQAEDVWNAFNRERFKLRLHVCYCSVLDDCWMLDTQQAEPRPIRACPIDSGRRWQQ